MKVLESQKQKKTNKNSTIEVVNLNDGQRLSSWDFGSSLDEERHHGHYSGSHRSSRCRRIVVFV